MAAGLIMFRCLRGGNENAGRRCHKAQLSSSLFLTSHVRSGSIAHDAIVVLAAGEYR